MFFNFFKPLLCFPFSTSHGVNICTQSSLSYEGPSWRPFRKVRLGYRLLEAVFHDVGYREEPMCWFIVRIHTDGCFQLFLRFIVASGKKEELTEIRVH